MRLSALFISMFLAIGTMLCSAQETKTVFENGIIQNNVLVQNKGWVECDTMPVFDIDLFFPAGLTWDGSFIWITLPTPPGECIVCKYDTIGTILKTVEVCYSDLSFDGTYLWGVIEQESLLHKLDTATFEVLEEFDLPSAGVYDPNGWGIAWDGYNLWHSDYGSNVFPFRPSYIYQINPSDGSVITSFEYENKRFLGIEYVDPYIYSICRNNLKMYKIDPDNGAIIDSIDWCIPIPLGLAWNDNYFFNVSGGTIIGGNQKLYKLFPDFTVNIPTIETKDVDIFPNPVKNILHIEGVVKNSEIRIYDINGMQLLFENINSSHHSINLSQYRRGIYMLQIKTGREVITYKIMKD